MQENLKAILLEIELALKNNEWDRALTLYSNLEKGWGSFQKELTLKEAEECLKIVNFLKNLLQEKALSIKRESDYLKIRQRYSKFV